MLSRSRESNSHQTSVKSLLKKVIPGWNEYVKPLKDTALFWYNIWKQCGSPRYGTVADIRRKTRGQYHKALRKVRAGEELIRAKQMATNMDNRNVTDFWSSVKKIKGNKSKYPTSVDGICGSENIATLFRDKHSQLCNSVSFNCHEMSTILSEIVCVAR